MSEQLSTEGSRGIMPVDVSPNLDNKHNKNFTAKNRWQARNNHLATTILQRNGTDTKISGMEKDEEVREIYVASHSFSSHQKKATRWNPLPRTTIPRVVLFGGGEG